MSKRKRKNKRAKNTKEKLNSSFPNSSSSLIPILDPADVLDLMARCDDKGCFHGFAFSDPKRKNDYETIQWLTENLPTLPYVLEQYMNFLFSNGLVSGTPEGDERLKNWLYKPNIKGIPNYVVLKEAIKNSIVWGKCGIRWLSEDDGIVVVPHTQYTSIVVDDETYGGFKRPVAYAISRREDEPINLADVEVNLDVETFTKEGILRDLENDVIVELPENFINLRSDISTEDGKSRLLEDRQRLEILANVYTRLNYDVIYDGPGRLIFWLKDDIYNTGTIDLSAGELIAGSVASKEKRAERARNELEGMAKAIKDSKSDNVILSSPMFDRLDHLPRVTKATEFFDYLNKEGSIVSQVIGITPELIGLGDVSGNVSMEKIIDNAMINVIVPQRESYATQISPMLSGKLGLPKIYFDKYELKNQIDHSSPVYKLALSIQQLQEAGYKDTADYLAKKIEEMI